VSYDDMTMFAGDLEPDLTIDVTNHGEPYDISAALSYRIKAYRGSTLLFDRVATLAGDSQVTMAWQTGDTTLVGPIRIYVVIEWEPGRVETIEPDNLVLVERL
jgi:hypothetical protein